MGRRALVLIGSPKGPDASASGRLSRILTARLEEGGWSIDRLSLYDADEGGLLSSISESDLVILASPLYVDSLPAPVIKWMELIAKERERRPIDEGSPRFVALLNCGFVEPKHNAVAERICRRFASHARFEWYGAISLGCAGMPRRRIARALEIAADALKKGFPVPPQVKRLTRRPVVPRLVYVIVGNIAWRRTARKKHSLGKWDLLAQPYKAE